MARTTPELPPLQTSTPSQWEDVWLTTYDLTCNSPTHKADVQWFQTWKTSGPEADTLLQGHCSPFHNLDITVRDTLSNRAASA
ncbi:hypothetical protein AVEN_181384-1 [Araneus ventricosus]|uniref:Uncharacterized protein n=1 Tax=Araneus ventricosus TaxID=182803 RepID=A0A4Y2S1W3_ARAVE|nr:hypothetical protein AVEN_181384-1 [Araneus ventricosus]